MIEEELKSIIEERCENQTISQYILDSIEFFLNRNPVYCNCICNNMKDLLVQQKNLVFKIGENNSSFFQNKNEIVISKKDIEICKYSIFIHEITHAIHYLQHSFNIPAQYESIRKKTVLDNNFMDLVHDIMKYIILIKKTIIEQLPKRRREQIAFSKIDEHKYIFKNSKINNYIFEYSNINNIIEIINNSGTNFNTMLDISKQMNRKFESLVDDIEFVKHEKGQLFHILSAIEGIVDSLILGNLHDGYGNECFYIKGWGHTKDYFNKNPELSYIELLADYSVLIAYNNDDLIDLVKNTIGEELCNMLNSSLDLIIGKNSIEMKKR